MASDTIVKILKLKDQASPELKKVSRSADDAGKKVDQLGKEVKQTGQEFKTGAKPVREWGAKTEVAGNKAKDAGGKAAGGAAGMKVFAASAAAGALAVLGAVKAFVALNQKLADARNELLDTSVKTGLAAETIGGLKLAAKGSGQELGSLASGLTQFPKRMADAARGTGEALLAFEKLGIEVNDSSGKMRSADAVLRETVAAINAVPDATQRSALATQAFGRAGTNLMVALSGESLEKFIALSKEFGVSVGPAAAASAARWQREMALWDTTVDGSLETLAAAISGARDMGEAAHKATLAQVAFVEVWASGWRNVAEVTVEPLAVIIDGFAALRLAMEGDLPAAADKLKNSMQGLLDLAIDQALGGSIGPDVTGFIAAGTEVDRLSDKVKELDNLDPTINVTVEWGTSPLDPSKVPGFSGPFDMMKAAGVKQTGGGGGKSKGQQELDKMTNQVGRLVSKAFPTSRIDKAAQLLDALEVARDNARRSRKAAFDALIVDARRAKDQIEKVQVAKAFEKISKEMAKDLATIESVAGGIEAGIAETIAAMEAAVADMWMALRESISKGVQGVVQSMTDLGGFIGGLGPEGAAVSALGGLGQQAAAQQDQTLSQLGAAKDERARLRESGGSAADMKANRDLIRTLEEQAEQGGMATLVEANVRGFVEGFKVLLQELPDVIGDVFPRLIGEGVPALIAGIIQATPKIAFAFLVRMPMAFAKGFVEGFKSVWDKIVSFFSRSFSAVISAISGGIIDEEGKVDVGEAGKAAGGAATGAAIGFAVGGPAGAAIGGLLGLVGGMAFQTGGVVNRTGMALVHANERILPTSGAVPQSARQMMAMGGGGAGVNVTINTNIVDPNSIHQLGLMLQRHFGSMGNATLPIFGGIGGR